LPVNRTRVQRDEAKGFIPGLNGDVVQPTAMFFIGGWSLAPLNAF
jgi:hypothetical protein